MTERKPTARERARARRKEKTVTPETYGAAVSMIAECLDHRKGEKGEACPSCGRCTARSARTGKPCKHWPIKGGGVCLTHGGSAKQVLKAAKRRLIALADPAIAALATVVRDKNASPADRTRAAVAILDRAGLGLTSQMPPDEAPYEVLVAKIARKARPNDGTVQSRYAHRSRPLPDPEEQP